MRLKLDEDLGATVAALLRRGGHDVATVPEQQLEGAPDTDVLAVYQREDRCLVTLDLDFSNPLVFDPRGLPGIAALRAPDRHTLASLTSVVETLLRALAHDTVRGQLWTVQPGRIRRLAPAPHADDST